MGMKIEVHEVIQTAINHSSNLSVASRALSQKLESFDIRMHGGELMSVPMVGNEIFNAE
jgi:hypothetical protein